MIWRGYICIKRLDVSFSEFFRWRPASSVKSKSVMINTKHDPVIAMEDKWGDLTLYVTQADKMQVAIKTALGTKAKRTSILPTSVRINNFLVPMVQAEL